MAGLTMAAHGWTISEACREFDAAGMPVDQAGFRAVVRAARRTGNLKPLGETKSGERGGRGQILYPIAELQHLHKDLTRWLTDSRPASMLQPTELAGDDDETELRRVPMRPVTEAGEAADAW